MQETKMRETLQMMGIGPVPYWMSWYIIFSCAFALSSFLVAIVCKWVYINTAPLMTFLLVFLYFVSNISFTWFLTVFCSTSQAV